MDDPSLATELEIQRDRNREATESVRALQAALRLALDELETMRTTLTAAQTAGSVATVRWQTLAAQLRDEHARLLGLLQALLDVRRMVRDEADRASALTIAILSRLEKIEHSAGLLTNEEGRTLHHWSAYRGNTSCGYPDGRTGVVCPLRALFMRNTGDYLYACEEHAR
jgi:hypothetical protein